jgi:single-strand DNA-binding protein
MAKRTISKTIIIGFLGNDPVMKFTAGEGKPFATMSVATNESWKTVDGKWKEETDWHRLVAWGKLADICINFLQKGTLAYFEGRIKYQKYTDKSGNERYTTSINVSHMQVLDGGKQHDTEQTSEPKTEVSSEDPKGSDLPF